MLKIESRSLLNAIKEIKFTKSYVNTTISALNGDIFVKSYNGEIYISKNIGGVSDIDCNIGLDDTTIKILSKIKDCTLNFEDNIIIAGNKKITFSSNKEIDFSIDEDVSSTMYIKLDDLLKLLSVNFCCAKDCTRPILQGVNINNNKGFIQACALDGYRLSLKGNRDYTFNATCDFTVKNEGITRLQKIAKKYEGSTMVKVDLLKSFVKFDFAGVEMYCRLLEGSFIKYDSLISEYNKDDNTLIKFDNIEQLLKDMELMKEVSEIVELRAGENGELILLSKSKNNNIEVITDCTIINIHENDKRFSSNKNLIAAYNINYLIQTLKTYKYEYMYCKNQISPAVLTDDYYCSYDFSLVLPIKIMR